MKTVYTTHRPHYKELSVYLRPSETNFQLLRKQNTSQESRPTKATHFWLNASSVKSKSMTSSLATYYSEKGVLSLCIIKNLKVHLDISKMIEHSDE